jgi:hypothetical protein
MDLIKAGRIGDARKLLKAEMERAKTEPNVIIQNKGGPVIFKHGRRTVEQDADGNWHFVKSKKAKPKVRRR